MKLEWPGRPHMTLYQPYSGSIRGRTVTSTSGLCATSAAWAKAHCYACTKYTSRCSLEWRGGRAATGLSKYTAGQLSPLSQRLRWRRVQRTGCIFSGSTRRQWVMGESYGGRAGSVWRARYCHGTLSRVSSTEKRVYGVAPRVPGLPSSAPCMAQTEKGRDVRGGLNAEWHTHVWAYSLGKLQQSTCFVIANVIANVMKVLFTIF